MKGTKLSMLWAPSWIWTQTIWHAAAMMASWKVQKCSPWYSRLHRALGRNSRRQRTGTSASLGNFHGNKCSFSSSPQFNGHEMKPSQKAASYTRGPYAVVLKSSAAFLESLHYKNSADQDGKNCQKLELEPSSACCLVARGKTSRRHRSRAKTAQPQLHPAVCGSSGRSFSLKQGGYVQPS